MNYKVTFIGAGSRDFGSRIIQDLFLSEVLNSEEMELMLMDLIEENIAFNANRARLLNQKLKRNITISQTTDLNRALADADIVICAIEKNRYLHWAQDFHIPRKYGFRQIFGENGGPGSLFHALRNIKPLIEIATTMEALCPHALLLNFTNPEHKVCEAVSRLTTIDVLGLCHGYFMGTEALAHIFELPQADIGGLACGMNHFIWFQTLVNHQTGEDLYPRLQQMEREADWFAHWHELGLSRILYRCFGLWPGLGTNHSGEYLRWAEEFMASEMHYFFDPAEGYPWNSGRMPEFVYTIDKIDTNRPFRPDASKPPAFETEAQADELKPSGEMAIPIMEGVLCRQKKHIPTANLPNRGAIPGIPDEMVVEIPIDIIDGQIRPVQMQPLPEPIAATIRLHASIHQLLVEAYAERSKKKLLQALLLEPTVNSYRQGVMMLDEMLALQKEVLPELE